MTVAGLTPRTIRTQFNNVHALLSVTGSSHPTRLRRALSVRRRVQRAGGGKVEIRPPKYGSERTVYLPDELIQLLRSTPST